MITGAPETRMALVLTRLHLLTLKQVASWDIEPAGTRLYQLVADNWKAIHMGIVVTGAKHRSPRWAFAEIVLSGATKES